MAIEIRDQQKIVKPAFSYSKGVLAQCRKGLLPASFLEVVFHLKAPSEHGLCQDVHSQSHLDKIDCLLP